MNRLSEDRARALRTVVVRLSEFSDYIALCATAELPARWYHSGHAPEMITMDELWALDVIAQVELIDAYGVGSPSARGWNIKECLR